jgi:hypothetical protein
MSSVVGRGTALKGRPLISLAFQRQVREPGIIQALEGRPILHRMSH